MSKNLEILRLLKQYPPKKREGELRAAIRRSQFRVILGRQEKRAIVKAVEGRRGDSCMPPCHGINKE